MTSDRSIRLPMLLLLLLLLVYRPFVFGEQYFIEKPQLYQEVSAGHDVRLRCIVQNKGGTCHWQKDGKPVQVHLGKYEWDNRDNGDCTLTIKEANLHFDDGFWECQVTSSHFTRQDSLTSDKARLLVRVKPKEPQLEITGKTLGTSLKLMEREEQIISCVSKHGNPPALIKWFIGNREVESFRPQSNATEVDDPKTWAAHSLLRMYGQRQNHGEPIRCVAIHPASLTPQSAETRLDIHYIPEVRLETNPQPLAAAPEDSVSYLNLKCLADANPVPIIKWLKNSMLLDASLTSLTQSKMTPLNDSMWSAELRFEPVTRRDAGLYSCRAENAVGESMSSHYMLDVQYKPELKSMDENSTFMDTEETALLGSTVNPFECNEFNANPPAQYRWVHLRGSLRETIENRVQNKGGGRRLHLENIMWSDEGEYRCFAFNTINGVRRETQDNKRYVLHVTGPPEIQVKRLPGDRDLYESVGWAGEPVHRLKSRFCSRPPPKVVTWEWGSSHIRAGENVHPKYEALPLEPIVEDKMVTNCYWAKLEIKDLRKEDARMYTLLVKSEQGSDSTNIRLIVRDPTEMRVIAATVAVGLLLLLLLISVSVYSLLRLRRGRYRQKVEEEGSIAADALYSNGASMDQQKSINSSHAKPFARKSSLDGGQNVYDYSRIAKQTRAMSPEALKVRRAPAVLQPPTIV
ncbi:hemicentin-1 [Solenopsis invicta]|uniref:hemicentin-1 n=1 Tax=Solenopsis invicta TaxID=13686 RepID=UPI0005961C66|nr:hemicentin-1 [Solenopsis invicta]XP_039310351.1 hemicentin-1 [Solenopsis invicta]XP_039310352.1 hemicentin-1 [Solenopsis invicta]XP_039310353.1 hemicentin-1 [Solenopsis invicta]